MMRRLLACTLLATLLAVPAIAGQQAPSPTRTPDVIFVPTPQEVVDAMLKLAKVTKNDVIYDLGSGDGRIPITAAGDWFTGKWILFIPGARNVES